MLKKCKRIKRHVKMALEYHKTVKCIIYKYTDAKTHRKHCTYAFRNMGFESSFPASHGSGIQNMNNLNHTGISHQNGIQLYSGAESSIIPQINPSVAG